MEIRRLHEEERERWLELLDPWDVGDGWRGRDFFRRPLERDPSHRDSDIWVVDDRGELVSTAQIFPRTLRVAGCDVPTGGIGSVFTREDRRGSGVASGLLERCVADMRERGIELSLLFAVRIPFYERLGWRSWKVPRELLRPAAEAPAAGSLSSAFDAERDLAGVTALHAERSGGLSGPALRDAAGWQTSLRLAGNPHEEFRVARDAEGVAAYVRAIRLNAALVVSEHAGRDPEAEAALLRGLLGARADDPLAAVERPSEALRQFAVLPGPAHAELARALEAAGVERTPVEDPTVMLRCLDSEALGQRIGQPPHAEEAADAHLRRVLPPERWLYWPSDRF